MTTGYVICTTPRSGSTLLGTLLEATGRAGHPWSYYHEPRFMAEWAAAWGLPEGGTPADRDAAYLRAAIAAGRGGSGLFAMRLQQPFLAPLMRTLGDLSPDARSDAERFARAFGPLRFVHLARQDTLAQAVSLVRARQGGLWHRHADGSERERTAPARPPAYDAAAITAARADLLRADRAWRRWFAREGIAPIAVRYERLARDPAGTLRDLCAALGIAPPATTTPGTARLADATSAAWIARHRAEQGRGNTAGDAT